MSWPHILLSLDPPRILPGFTWTETAVHLYPPPTDLREPELGPMRIELSLLLLFCSLLLSIPFRTLAADEFSPEVGEESFAVDTRVFFAQSKEPSTSTTTVFRDRRVYDEMIGAGRTAVFDFENQRVSLLSESIGCQTSISFEVVLECQAELLDRARQRAGLGAFLAQPQFIREFDAGSSTITLRSPWLTYAAHGKQTVSDQAERFLEFADWSARLGSLLNPLAPPARARLELNTALKKQNWQVDRITRTGGPRARQLGSVHSEHVYRNRLSESDRDLIERLEKGLKTFRQISFSEYRKLQTSTTAVTKE